ncbi:MAG: hypothetical protein ABJB16_05705, partial [Saprospiraceae bacterium]
MKKFYLPILCLSMLTSIVAFSQAGSPDPTFNGNGLVSTFFFPEAHTNAFGVMVQNDNAIVVTGFSGVPNSKSIGILLRYLEDGSPDQSFNGSGKVYIAYPDVHCLGSGSLQQPDGKIVTLVRLSGLTKDSIALFRFNPDGTSDFTFDEDGIATLDMGKNYQGPGSLAIQSDGKLVVGGYVGNANESFDQFFIARFLPNGAHDTGFDGDGFVITTVGETYTNVASVLIQPDGKIIAAGYATFDSLESITVVRYLPNGALDHTFHQDGISHITIAGANAAGTGAILQPDGKIVVGGNVNVINSKSDFVAVRFKSDGYPDNSFDGD